MGTKITTVNNKIMIKAETPLLPFNSFVIFLCKGPKITEKITDKTITSKKGRKIKNIKVETKNKRVTKKYFCNMSLSMVSVL